MIRGGPAPDVVDGVGAKGPFTTAVGAAGCGAASRREGLGGV